MAAMIPAAVEILEEGATLAAEIQGAISVVAVISNYLNTSTRGLPE